MSHDNQTPFGEDINATPLTKLQPTVSTKKDMTPLDMPVYNPRIETEPAYDESEPPEKQVRFARPVARRPPQQRRPHRRIDERKRFQKPTATFRRSIGPPPVSAPAPEEKTHKVARFLQDYGGRILVFVLVLLVVFLYQKMIAVPYIGNGQRVTFIGSVFLASAASGVWGLAGAFL